MGLFSVPMTVSVTCVPVQVVSPTISSPVCQEQLVEAGKLVDRSVETCVKACRLATDDGELLKQVGAAAGVVSQALCDLLHHVRHYASCGEPIGRYDQATDTIMNVTENIFTSMGDAGEFRGGGGGGELLLSEHILLQRSHWTDLMPEVLSIKLS